MIDLPIVLGRLRPGESYRLNRSVPPHYIVEWRGVSPLPTQTEIETEWLVYENEEKKEELTLESLEKRIEKLEEKTQ